MRVQVRNHRGMAHITLVSNGIVVGTASITRDEYEQAVKSLLLHVAKMARESIAQTLNTRLWHDAQAQTDGDAEHAKKLLRSFNWNQEKVDAYADELARNLAQDLTEHLPEHQ